jgi:hypothetical protein
MERVIIGKYHVEYTSSAISKELHAEHEKIK